MSSVSSQPTPLTPFQVNCAEPAQFRQFIRQALADTRVSIPAFMVQDMDVATQTVTVQIAIQERVRTPKGPQWQDLPPIARVPPMIYRGGGFSVTLPLKKGTEGMLIFCDCCFDLWWNNGTNNAPPAQNLQAGQGPSGSQQQIGMHRHEFWDCGFYPGLSSQPNILSDYSTDSLQIRSDDGTTVIDVSESGVNITAPEVNAKSTGGTPLALVNDTWFQWWKTNIYPFLVSKGYAGPGIPLVPETTVLKGQ